MRQLGGSEAARDERGRHGGAAAGRACVWVAIFVKCVSTSAEEAWTMRPPSRPSG